MYHTQSKHAENNYYVVKNGISNIVKLLKLVCSFAIWDAPILFMTSPQGEAGRPGLVVTRVGCHTANILFAGWRYPVGVYT